MAKDENVYRTQRFSETDLTYADRVIFKGSCLLHSVHVCADGANAQVDIYDGVDANGRHIARINVLSESSYTWKPRKSRRCNMGIYVDVGAATDFVTVEFEPLAKTYNPQKS